MDRFIAPTKFIQYQLWQDCSNGCKFCSEKCPTKADKVWSLSYILNCLEKEEVKDYEEVGIIGGEIFDYQLDDVVVEELFYTLLRKICCMHFKKIYIATNLIYDMDKHLVKCLNFLRDMGVADKVLICTSYDTKWRFDGFKCKRPKKWLFRKNMERLHKEFSDFRTHIEIILTGDFIDKVLSGDFDIAYFSNYYHSRVDFIEPASGMYYEDKEDLQKVCPNFFPTRQQFINFLMQEGVQKKTIDLRCLISYQIRASRIYHLDLGQYVCYEDRRQPGFRVQCLDPTRKYELGMIDTDESMEDICVQLCEMLPDE